VTDVTETRSTLRPLTISRVVDQAALGLASLLLARVLGPDAFAPVAVLFIVNSLAVQISDFGVGFAIYRSPPGTRVARRSLDRLRAVNAAIAVAAIAVGALLHDADGAVIAAGGVVWLLTSEAYVRKAAALKQRATTEVVRAEITSAILFLGIAAVLAALDADPLWAAVPFVVKHLVEVVGVRSWSGAFAADGVAARSGAEWLGQVMTYLVANVDYVLIGWLLGPELLSLYVIAFRFASSVPAFLANPITQTAFLDFAAAPPERRQPTYDHLLRRVGSIGTVGALVLVVAAPLLPWVLGSDWSQTAPLLALLAVAVPWRLLLGSTVALAITAGGARLVVVWEAARLVATAGLVVIATSGGLSTTAAIVSFSTVVLLAAEHALACRLAAVTPPKWLFAATAVVATALVIVAVAVSG
jgi:O-antigen/teichoic acid export membrane protein